MNEKIKKAFKLFCEQYVKDLNRLENKEIAKDYFYNPKYECGLQFDGKTVYIADILGAFDNMEELIKGKDEYIAKLCNDIAELKEHEKELIAEQHRLFDLAKEQENELKELKEFAKLVSRRTEHYFQEFATRNINQYVIKETYFVKGTDKEFDLVKEVVEKYGK